MALVKRKVSRLYTDLDLAFGKNFFSDDIDKKIDVNSVKQSIKILLSTMPYERPFQDVVVTSNYDLQVYEVSIYFKIVGVPEPAILTLTLSRLR